jgi:LysM domain
MSTMTTGEPGRRAGTAPRGLTVAPPQRAAAAERPRVPAPVPKPGTAEGARAGRRAPLPPARSRTRPRSRLTRRGRIVVSALVLALMLLVAALAWIAGATKAEAAGSGPPSAAVYRGLAAVVVRPGQSLWTIAAQAEPAADPRGVIQEIIDLNALGGTAIQPGQHLWVPRS